MQILASIEVPDFVMEMLSVEDNSEAWAWVNARVAAATDPKVVFGEESNNA